MEIVTGRSYAIVVRFPWGERMEQEVGTLSRDADGTLRWSWDEGACVEPYLDNILCEEKHYVFGWVGGSCDVTAVISVPVWGSTPISIT